MRRQERGRRSTTAGTTRQRLQGRKRQVASYPLDKRYLFGQDVPYSKMMVTKEGTYSITPKYQRDQIIQIMTGVLPKPLTEYSILDGTAGNGGDLVSFSRVFKSVVGVELDVDNYDATVHNMNVIGAKNVEVKNGNILKELNGITEDILYIDPPWGGKDYVKQDSVDLKLGYSGIDKSVGLILRAIMKQNTLSVEQRQTQIKPDYFFVKAPKNVDLSKYPKHRVYQVMNPRGKISFLLIVGVFNDSVSLN